MSNCCLFFTKTNSLNQRYSYSLYMSSKEKHYEAIYFNIKFNLYPSIN